MPQENEDQTTRGIKKPSAGPRPFVQGKHRLLVIGIDKYQHCPPLYNAVKDARDLLKILQDDYLFTPENTKTLYDEAATQGAIYQALEELDRTCGPTDNLLIFFSGHGEFKESIDEGFWIPVDGRQDNHGSFFSFSILAKYIRAINTRHTVVIADSCYAGSMFTQRKLGKEKEALRKLYAIPSRWLLTAGRNEVVADGKPGDNSPFADSLNWHLKNHEDELISMRNLCDRVITGVSSNARQIPRGEPMYNVGHRGGEFLFIRNEYRDFFKEVEEIEEPVVSGAENGGGTNGRRKVKPVTPTPQPDPTPAQPDNFASLDELKSALQRLLAASEIERVFGLFDKTLNSNASLANDLILTRGQFSSLQRDRLNGLISDEQANLNLNRIRNALLYYVKQLEEEDLKKDALTPEDPAPQPGQAESARTSDLAGEAKTLRKKITFFQNEMDGLSDPNERFNLNLQIEEAKARLKDIGQAFGDEK